MNQESCDWFTLIKNGGKFYKQKPKQNHKYPDSFCLTESSCPGVRKLHKYYILPSKPHFPDIEITIYWGECACYSNNTMLGNAIEKKWKSDIAKIVKKKP